MPQVDADVDREKAKSQGVSVQELFDTMQVYLGSLYVNDFNAFGRTYPVTAQAEPGFRLQAEDVVRLKTRNAAGDMIPLGSFVTVKRSSGPDRVMHYNSYPTAEINGGPAPGFSSGQAQAAMERLARQELPNGMSFEWTELTYQQIIAGNTAVLIFPLVVLLVFLVLAAQYESLSLPLAVILIMPMVLLSAITGVELTHGDSNIFTQIGLIVLVGLASKNAILIVEFARDQELEGVPPLQAALNAARLRLRPILMTSMAFIMGVVPLVTSTGAGAEMRHAMGIAVFSGMLGVTVFGLLLTPLFYVLVRKISHAHARRARKPLPRRDFSIIRRSAMRPVDHRNNEGSFMKMVTAIALATLALTACAVGPNYRAPKVAPAVLQNAPVDRIRHADLPKRFGGRSSATPNSMSLVQPCARAPIWICAPRTTGSGQPAPSSSRENSTTHRTCSWTATYTHIDEQQPGFGTDRFNTQSDSLGFDAAWEIDLFGHVRRSVEAARADFGAERANYQDAQVTVAAEVARNYFELRGAQKRLAVARENLSSEHQTLELTELLDETGRGSELDVQRSRARLKATEATIPPLEAAEKQAGYRLAVLLGERPGALDQELHPAAVATYAKALPIGDPD